MTYLRNVLDVKQSTIVESNAREKLGPVITETNVKI